MKLSLLRKKNQAEHFNEPERVVLRIVKPAPAVLPTSDVKGSPSEHLNTRLLNQIRQVRALLVSETKPAEKRQCE